MNDNSKKGEKQTKTIKKYVKLRKEEQYSNALTEKNLYKDFNMTNNRCQRHRNIDAIARSTIHQVPSIYYVITFRGEGGT